MIALLVFGAAVERICEWMDMRRLAPPTFWVRVGARRLYVQCAGAGEPLIVLEAGLDDDSTVWDKVYTPLTRLGRTCRYDRAGLGWSDGARASHTPDEAVFDLQAVIRATHAQGPKILIGHSFGGMLVRLFTARHPEEVGGIVLVDAAHEDQFAPPYNLPSEIAGWRADPKPLLATFGILRMEDAFNPNADRDGPEARALRLRADRYWTLRETSRNMGEFEAAVRQAPPLGERPLAVITAMAKPIKYLPAWEALQSRLAEQSRCAIHVYAKNSRHYVQKDDPTLVTQSAAWVVAKAKSEGMCARR